MTRDMTERQFQAALRRHGITADPCFGCWFASPRAPGLQVGGVFHADGTIARRATLAYVLQTVEIREAFAVADRCQAAEREGSHGHP